MVRRNLIASLQLLASPEAQIEFQLRAPTAHLTNEMFSGWSENYQSLESQEAWVQTLFSDSELRALKRFDEVFRGIKGVMPDEFAPITEFVQSPLSVRLAVTASLTLFAFPAQEKHRIAREELPATHPDHREDRSL
jgi:hypothetical protein